MENSWGGFSQTGFSILLTPKNQNSPVNSSLCPLCRVTDVTIRDCWIAHVASGLQIATVFEKGGEPSAAGERYSIHDVVIDDINGKQYGGFGAFMVLITNQPTLKDVRLDHITAVINPRVFMNVGVKQAHIQNFVFTNNLVGANEQELTSTSGGPENCVFQPTKVGPATILKNCFDGITFSNNAIINGSGGWPPGNFNPKDLDAVGFVKNASGLDAFRLCREKSSSCKGPSKYASAGTDHKDLGADIDAIISATRGVAE
jgi:hypothetical protein